MAAVAFIAAVGWIDLNRMRRSRVGAFIKAMS
jgi:hypothetical protein